MKKILSMLCCIIIIFSCVGCESKKVIPESAENATGAIVTEEEAASKYSEEQKLCDIISEAYKKTEHIMVMEEEAASSEVMDEMVVVPQSPEEERLFDLISKEYEKTEHEDYPECNIVYTVFDDFNSDGIYELIAVCGETDDRATSCGSEIWYATGDTAEYIWGGYTLLPKIIEWNEYKFLKIECLYWSESVSYYFLIKNNQLFRCSIDSFAVQGLYPSDETGEFTACHSTYDMSSDGTGHTWKHYDLYYSSEDNTFRHYVGVEISKDEFLKETGAKEIMDRIPQKYVIAEIYKRCNGVININLREYWEGELDKENNLMYNNYYITLRRTQEGLVVVEGLEDEKDGFYLP